MNIAGTGHRSSLLGGEYTEGSCPSSRQGDTWTPAASSQGLPLLLSCQSSASSRPRSWNRLPPCLPCPSPRWPLRHPSRQPRAPHPWTSSSSRASGTCSSRSSTCWPSDRYGPAPPAPPLLPRGTWHSPLCLGFHVCTGAKDGAVPLPRAWSETVVAPPALPPPLLCLAQPLTPDPKVGSPPSELIA